MTIRTTLLGLLGQRRADDHRGADVGSGLWVAAEGLHRALDRVSDTEAGAKAADADRESRADRLRRRDALFTCHAVEHVDPPGREGLPRALPC